MTVVTRKPDKKQKDRGRELESERHNDITKFYWQNQCQFSCVKSGHPYSLYIICLSLCIRSGVKPTASTTFCECKTKPLSQIMDSSCSAPFNSWWLRIGRLLPYNLLSFIWNRFVLAMKKYTFQVMSNWIECVSVCVPKSASFNLISFVNLLALKTCEKGIHIFWGYWDESSTSTAENNINSNTIYFISKEVSNVVFAFSVYHQFVAEIGVQGLHGGSNRSNERTSQQKFA